MIRGRLRLGTTSLLCALMVVAAVTGSAGAKQPGTARPLLPNLVVFAPMEVYEGDCDPYEQVERGAERCLRYETTIGNFGGGPLELRYLVDQLGGDQDLLQRIFLKDGSFVDRRAGTYELHPAHAHFHYAGFAMARLWRASAFGKRRGSEPVRESRKNGFCIYDNENHWSERDDSREPHYSSEPVCRPTAVDGEEVVQVNGLSVGWTDTYDPNTTDQFVEITELAPGYYLLELIVDPLNSVWESDEQDNSATVLIRIEREGTEVVR